jgi:fermentation-respiration switch protein FrsA (DUF1100 family)
MNWQRVSIFVSSIVAAAYMTGVFLIQRPLLFPKPQAPVGTSRPHGASQVWLATSRARVEAWYLPPEVAIASPGPAIIFFHGNAELIDFVADDFEVPRRWGIGVLVVEFPGYGRSAGSPSEASIAATALAAYDWLSQQAFVDRERVIAYGRSLGGAAAAIIAARRHPAALVLESTFTSVRSFAHRFWIPELMVLDPFDNLASVKSYAGPVLVLQGQDDDIVPPAHAKLLASASSRAELHLLSCGHNDCERPWDVVRAFLTANQVIH